jgi:carbon storage regulator
MLVLTRKSGEGIVVPQCKLTITVLGVEGNRVRLGLSAPDEIEIYREEVWCGFRMTPARLRAMPSPTKTNGHHEPRRLSAEDRQ